MPQNQDGADNPELPDEIYCRVVELSELANAALDRGDPEKAIVPLCEALDLLPVPQYQWEAWTWLNATLGDAYWELSNYQQAKIVFYDAMNGPGGITNPFILLRLGQSLFELGEQAKAKSMFAHAYILEGDSLFSEESPKYLALLKQR